jgi:hypothetical protein
MRRRKNQTGTGGSAPSVPEEGAQSSSEKGRRTFLANGLKVGTGVLLGAGATGAIGRLTGNAGGAANNNVVNNPTSTSQNTIVPGNPTTIDLQVRRYSATSGADLLNVLREDGVNKLININSQGSLDVGYQDGMGNAIGGQIFVAQGYAALRVQNSNGFREMHFRDASTSPDILGRHAFLVADRVEWLQSHLTEHFWGNALPAGLWESAGSGTIAFEDKPNGMFLANTGTIQNSNIRIGMTRKNHQLNYSPHLQVGFESMTGSTNVIIVVGLCDSSVSQVTDLSKFGLDGPMDPTVSQNAVWVEYNADASATSWRARHKNAGYLQQDSVTNPAVGFVTGRQWWRFEFWPAGQVGLTTDTVEVFHSSGPKGGTDPVAKLQNNLAGSIPMRPYIGIQTKSTLGMSNQIEVDYVFAYEGQ